MRKKIINPRISEILLDILSNTTSSVSVSQLKKQLEEYDINVSPQVVKRHLEELAKKGDIEKV